MIKAISKIKNINIWKKPIFIVFLILLLVTMGLIIRLVVKLENNKPQQTSFNSDIDNKLSVVAAEKTKKPEYFTSFGDLFSSSAWVDKQQTTLFHDLSGMTLTFQPNIQWHQDGLCLDRPAECQVIEQSLKTSAQCFGDNCLSVQNNTLFYREQLLALPPGTVGELVNLAVTRFDDRWLVTAVMKIEDDNYRPLIWWFNSGVFSVINLVDDQGNIAQSRYFGKIAVGGQADNLLLLYSAYDGLAWQIRGTEVKNLSYYFGLRVNAGGFYPKIINFQQDNETVWFVFNQNESPVRLLKFWQNGSGWIEGMLDLSEQLPRDSRSAYFMINWSDPNSLRAKITNLAGQSQLWTMRDNGFTVLSGGQVTSVNLMVYNQDKPQIIGALITDIVGGWSNFKDQWFLSVNGVDWLPIQLNQRLNFEQPTNQLWWRWQVGPGENRQQSPCLKKITINYFRQ